MKLNHLGITVSDVVEARIFLETYFGLKGIGKNNPKLTHLRDDDGFILSLVEGEPESTHIGFMQETEAQVNAVYERLKGNGFDVPPPTRSHGWTFYFVAPGGLTIEVVC